MKKRADGRYQKKIVLPDGVKKVVYGKSPTEVNRKAREAERAAAAGVKLGDHTTVAEWAEQWLLTYKSCYKFKTKEQYVNCLNNHILEFIGPMPLKAVKAVHIVGIMNKVSDMSESLQGKVLRTCRQMMRDARINHLIEFDPTEGIKINKNTEDDKIKFLSEEQQAQLLELVVDPQARLFVSIALYTGLRRGEVLGLQWGDIDFEHSVIHVRRSLTFLKNQPDPDMSLKTKASNRDVPLLSVLREVLEQTPRTSMYIITKMDGLPMTQMSFRRLWNHVAKVVSFHVHPHMLRHTYTTTLYKAGVDLKTAQYILGHADIKMTANIYTHIEKGTTVKAMNKIENYLSGSQIGSQIPKKPLQMAK